MIYEIIQPCEELKDLVSHFWVGTWDASGEPNTSHYVIAGSLAELTFAFDRVQGNLSFSAVQGQTELPRRFSVEGFRHLIGVSFYPHAIYRFFDVLAAGINGEFISLHTFLGREGAVLNEKIASAANTPQRIQLLSDHFMATLKKGKREDGLIAHAAKEIRRHDGQVKIAELAQTFCLSHKQFNRRFLEFSGFTPKTYSRIIRLESVIRNFTGTASLTETAHANGYYDQAHFIHEFKSLTGFVPTDFWKMGEAQK